MNARHRRSPLHQRDIEPLNFFAANLHQHNRTHHKTPPTTKQPPPEGGGTGTGTLALSPSRKKSSSSGSGGGANVSSVPPMRCGQCGYAEASTPRQLRQHVRKRHEPKLESSSGVILQLESGEFVPASEKSIKRGKSRGGQVRMNLNECKFFRVFFMCKFVT